MLVNHNQEGNHDIFWKFSLLGVPKTMELEVINESLVEVNANIKISSDGPEWRSITLRDYAVADRPKPQVPQWPREFVIEPCKIQIGRESTVSLRVSATESDKMKEDFKCLKISTMKTSITKIIPNTYCDHTLRISKSRIL